MFAACFVEAIEEIEKSRAHLERAHSEFEAVGVQAQAELAFGDPVREIVKWVEERGYDLLAMGTHGHGIVGDLLFGATAIRDGVDQVQLLQRHRQPAEG